MSTSPAETPESLRAEARSLREQEKSAKALEAEALYWHAHASRLEDETVSYRGTAAALERAAKSLRESSPGVLSNLERRAQACEVLADNLEPNPTPTPSDGFDVDGARDAIASMEKHANMADATGRPQTAREIREEITILEAEIRENSR